MKQTVYNDVKGLNKVLRQLPKDASVRLRDASVVIASDVAREASAKAMGIGGPASLVAPTIKGTRDRVPVVKQGGTKRLRKGSARQTVGDLMFGAEFGGGAKPRTSQFMPHKGRTGYFLFPTIKENRQDIHDEYDKALMKALQDIK